MRFQDVIKESILDTFHSGNLFISQIVISLGIACVFGAYLYLLYRITSRNDFYNRDFNKSLALLPMITAGILLAMQSNLIVSLGMVGALSIVRFRTAIKNPIDLVFLFFAISAGIIIGTGVYKLVFFSVIFFTAMVFLLDLFPTFRPPYLLVVSADDISVEKPVLQLLKSFCRTPARLRNRSISMHGVEMIWEIRTKRDSELVEQISKIEKITSVNLIAHDGELRI